MHPLLLVCLGGAAGSGLRYIVSHGLEGLAARGPQPGFPWGTLAVNVVGSFLLGMLLTARTGASDGGGEIATDWGAGISPTWRYALGTGALGGFTTYSTFNYETLCLFQAGHLTQALTYTGMTLALCLLAGTAGMLLGRTLLP